VQNPLTSVLIALLVAALMLIIVLWRRYENLLRAHQREIKEASRKSVDQSRRTLKGQIAEQLAPLMSGFPYAAADARFLGNPIDYIVFRGLSELQDDDGDADNFEIVLLEIKHGQSRMKGAQPAIAAAVEQGRVRFEVCRIAEDGTLTTNSWRPKRRGAALAQD
jgi:predicted Holliday junction resolvase-like endonuclease